ncbi:MAG: hypothetical protein Q8K67_14555 [Geothrix sp.]|nr:hypothetical protein [Geothrix sp.]
MKTFAEFHDSQIRTISRHGDEIVVELPYVYLYLFEGTPFQEPGTGCGQIGRLVFTGVQSSEIPDLPLEHDDDTFDIWRGSIWVNDEHINGVFEIPLDIQSSNVRAEIQFNLGATFKVSCTGISYSGLSEPRFIERYRT